MRHRPQQQHQSRYRQNRPQLESLEDKVLLSTLPAPAAAGARSPAVVRIPDTSGGFVSSPSNRFPRARFVTQLYETILGREPDRAGLTFWVRELQRGVSPSAVRRQFQMVAQRLQVLNGGTAGQANTGTSAGGTTATVNVITRPITSNAGFGRIVPAFGNALPGSSSSLGNLGTGSSLTGGGTGTATGGTSLGTGATTTTTTTTTTTGGTTGTGFGAFPVPLVVPPLPGSSAGVSGATGTGVAGTGTSGVNTGTDLTGTGAAGTGTAGTGNVTGTGTNTTGA